MLSHARKPERLTAKLKFEIYLKAPEPGAPVAEILRYHGLHLDDLKRISEAVEAGAVAELKRRGPGRKTVPIPVDPTQYRTLQRELIRKEKALLELAVENTLLKRLEALEAHPRRHGGTSMGSNGR